MLWCRQTAGHQPAGFSKSEILWKISFFDLGCHKMVTSLGVDWLWLSATLHFTVQQHAEKYDHVTHIHAGCVLTCDLSMLSHCRWSPQPQFLFPVHSPGTWSAFRSWNVQQKCSVNMFISNFHNVIMWLGQPNLRVKVSGHQVTKGIVLHNSNHLWLNACN